MVLNLHWLSEVVLIILQVSLLRLQCCKICRQWKLPLIVVQRFLVTLTTSMLSNHNEPLTLINTIYVFSLAAIYFFFVATLGICIQIVACINAELFYNSIWQRCTYPLKGYLKFQVCVLLAALSCYIIMHVHQRLFFQFKNFCKDLIKVNLQHANVYPKELEAAANDKVRWCTLTEIACKSFEERRC